MRQVANDISTQSNSLETALGEGILEWKRHRKSIYQSNDNAAVEVSPAMENLRIERGSVGDHYTSLQRLQKRKKMRKL